MLNLGALRLFYLQFNHFVGFLEIVDMLLRDQESEICHVCPFVVRIFTKFVECCTFKLIISIRKYVHVHKIDPIKLSDNPGHDRTDG